MTRKQRDIAKPTEVNARASNDEIPPMLSHSPPGLFHPDSKSRPVHFLQQDAVSVDESPSRQRLADLVVQCVLERLVERGFSNASSMLAVGYDTSVAAKLVKQGMSVDAFVASSTPANPPLADAYLNTARRSVSTCIFDGTLEFVDDPSSLLAAAYSLLAPGGLLVVRVHDMRNRDKRRFDVVARQNPQCQSLFGGSSLQSLVFREGFVAPRCCRTADGALILTAQRSDLAPPHSRPLRLSVVVPVYNEVQTFPKVMDALLTKTIPGVQIQVVVVESNSDDGSRELAIGYEHHPRVSLVLEERPRGKGHAVRTGLAEADGDFVLIQDADLEYDIADYETLLAPLQSLQTGFVLGVRAQTRQQQRGIRHFESAALVSTVMNLGNSFFVTLFNLTYQQRLHDPFTMAKVFRRDCVSGISLECNRFDFDWELLAKLIRAGYAPVEVPISYRSRSFAEGKKIRFFRDPLTWIVACFKYRRS
ncbi:MAG TPA: glycosyltransferase family 2 protein [Acidimicrobiales bacterium]|nr:glycosyltransferase family 2 protein [Acidimicrobiales bacterium]